MPSPDTKLPPAVDPDPEAKPPEPPAAPTGPTREEFDTMRAQLAHMGGNLEGLVASLQQMNMRAPATAPAPARRLTDEEIQAAFDEGKGPQVIRALLNEQAQDLVSQHINPLRETGLGAIANLTHQNALTRMPHYQRFKREIDAYVNTLPPEAQTNPEAWVIAHNYVAYQPANFQQIMDEQVEAELRKRAAPGGAAEAAGASGPGRTQAQPRQSGIPTPEEAWPGEKGAAAMAAIRAQGLSLDQWAQKLGYSDWDDYWTRTEPDNVLGRA